MLLIVKVCRDGKTLECWMSSDVEPRFIDPPESPFFYTLSEGDGEAVSRRLLSNVSLQQTISKVECETVYDVARRRRMYRSIENEVRFVERLAQDFGFKQNDTHVTSLSFDTEQATSGQFPKADRDRTRALAFYNNRVQRCLTEDQVPEYEMYAQFCDVVKRQNPDVLLTFSGTAHDYDYLLSRCQLHGVDFPLGRLNDSPYTVTREFSTGKRKGVDKTTYLHGRICFDIFKEALFDSSLSGVRHDLKSVARALLPDPELVREVDRQQLEGLESDSLYDYCLSDARITYLIGQHYLEILTALAARCSVPLDFIIHRSPSHIGNIFYGRGYNELGIVSDGTNFDRHVKILNLKRGLEEGELNE